MTATRRDPSTSTGAVRAVRLLALGLIALGAVGLGACRHDMQDQPKYEALEGSRFFSNSSAARMPPEHTVARGELREDSVYYSGFTPDDQLVPSIPMKVTAQTLKRGQATFNAFCSPCHDRAGTGRGMIVRRGFPQPPTYHQERLRTAPDGYFFDVMTNGFGRMPSYASQVPVEDRWAVVAYIRALQLSQHAPIDELPEEMRAKAQDAGFLPPEITQELPGEGATPPEPPPVLRRSEERGRTSTH